MILYFYQHFSPMNVLVEEEREKVNRKFQNRFVQFRIFIYVLFTITTTNQTFFVVNQNIKQGRIEQCFSILNVQHNKNDLIFNNKSNNDKKNQNTGK